MGQQVEEAEAARRGGLGVRGEPLRVRAQGAGGPGGAGGALHRGLPLRAAHAHAVRVSLYLLVCGWAWVGSGLVTYRCVVSNGFHREDKPVARSLRKPDKGRLGKQPATYTGGESPTNSFQAKPTPLSLIDLPNPSQTQQPAPSSSWRAAWPSRRCAPPTR